jgi:hypothetical protein
MIPDWMTQKKTQNWMIHSNCSRVRLIPASPRTVIRLDLSRAHSNYSGLPLMAKYWFQA